jgi:hypothetical protein
MAHRGDLLTANSEIDQEITPVIVVTDENMAVLTKIDGGTLTGAPNTSEAFLQFPIPADGKYWLLFGEANRTARDIHTGASLLMPAGHSCHSGPDDCLSARCDNGTCALSKPGGGDQQCVNNSDCTTGQCDNALVCAFAPLGGACTGNDDCVSSLCDHGACSCLAKGTAVDNDTATRCCAKRAVADASDVLRCQ